jgi:putative ABC transport system ATP-binding protein
MQVELTGLKKCFGDHILFDGFDFAAGSGELVAVTGGSGSGKTTLLNVLGLIEKMDAGEIRYGGRAIRTSSQKRKLLGAQIGFIFQNFGLIDNESVYNNLAIIKQMQGKRSSVKRERMAEALEQVGLSKQYLGKKAFECSGGEQQRIAIAKILLKDCEVVFADEPTASLDDENKKIVLSHLERLHAAGKTIIVVSHDHGICGRCDRVISIGK